MTDLGKVLRVESRIYNSEVRSVMKSRYHFLDFPFEDENVMKKRLPCTKNRMVQISRCSAALGAVELVVLHVMEILHFFVLSRYIVCPRKF